MSVRGRGALIACVLALGAPAAARAATLYVDASAGSDASDGSSWAGAKATIGAALTVAAGTPESDEVLVAEGRYPEFLAVPPDTMLRGGYASGGATRDPRAHPSVIDGESTRRLLEFRAGTDGSGIEGFTLTRGASADLDSPVILLEATAAAFRDCIVETCRVSNGAAILKRDRGTSLIERCLFRDNAIHETGFVIDTRDEDPVVAPLMRDSAILRTVVPVRPTSRLAMIALRGARSPSTLLVPFLERCLLEDIHGDDASPSAYVQGLLGGSERDYWFKDTIIRRCETACVHFVGPRTGRWRFENCLLVSHGYGVAIYQPVAYPSQVGQAVTEYVHSTVAGHLDYRNETMGGASLTIVAERSIFVGRLGYRWPDSYITAAFTDCLVTETRVADGATVSNVIIADPRFAVGRVSGQYLSQVGCGQAVDSSALDQGPPDATSAGLSAPYTTCITGAPDLGAVDWGFHAGPFGFSVFPDADMTGNLRILRGPTPLALSLVATPADLDWSDAPGVLDDPGLPLLFYRVEGAFQPIVARPSPSQATVTLAWRPD